LTPVTLELGGKSPCIVDSDAQLGVTAKRIAWGKFTNVGQTCIAPDYILVHKNVAQKFSEILIKTIAKFYGTDPKKSEDYSRVINKNHTLRLKGLIEQSQKDGAQILSGGVIDVDERYISPTILKNVNWNTTVMKDEIFGPILPIIEVDSVEDAVQQINAHEKPLALYYFGSGKSDYVISNTSSGGTCINDCLVHIGNPELPFGGVGSSGMGACHGDKSFEIFSHERSIMKKKFILDSDLRYPPYSSSKLKTVGVLRKVTGTQLLVGVSVVAVVGASLVVGSTALIQGCKNLIISGLQFGIKLLS